MAGNKKVFDLPLRTGVTDDDRLIIVDSGNTETSSVKVSDLRDGTGVSTLNTLTGGLTLSGGTNITITDNGTDTITFDASGGGGGSNYWTGVTTGSTDNLITDFSSIDAAFTTNTIATDGTQEDSLVLGWGNSTNDNKGSVFFGANNTGVGVIVGNDMDCTTERTIHIGFNGNRLKSDVSIGRDIANSGNNPTSINIGGFTTTTSFRNIAIGGFATAGGGSFATALGYQTTASGTNTIALGESHNITGTGNNGLGGHDNDITSTGTYNNIIGGTANVISGSVSGATILGMSSYTGATTDDAVYMESIILPNYASYNYANDGDAAAGGIALGQVYHHNGALRIRIV